MKRFVTFDHLYCNAGNDKNRGTLVFATPHNLPGILPLIRAAAPERKVRQGV